MLQWAGHGYLGKAKFNDFGMDSAVSAFFSYRIILLLIEKDENTQYNLMFLIEWGSGGILLGKGKLAAFNVRGDVNLGRG